MQILTNYKRILYFVLIATYHIRNLIYHCTLVITSTNTFNIITKQFETFYNSV
jgi:hypothetical protein